MWVIVVMSLKHRSTAPRSKGNYRTDGDPSWHESRHAPLPRPRPSDACDASNDHCEMRLFCSDFSILVILPAGGFSDRSSDVVSVRTNVIPCGRAKLSQGRNAAESVVVLVQVVDSRPHHYHHCHPTRPVSRNGRHGHSMDDSRTGAVAVRGGARAAASGGILEEHRLDQIPHG
ncbi:unnamed protein product [Soboliphyme baturini]|uniref:Secreted protein n=1 Tax=Soboliphyme baturini TaxID=241478 RepID=A0A183IF32_9BILA|nr:unnamed protein product [Soboliphyme baturini]